MIEKYKHSLRRGEVRVTVQARSDRVCACSLCRQFRANLRRYETSGHECRHEGWKNSRREICLDGLQSAGVSVRTHSQRFEISNVRGSEREHFGKRCEPHTEECQLTVTHRRVCAYSADRWSKRSGPNRSEDYGGRGCAR